MITEKVFQNDYFKPHCTKDIFRDTLLCVNLGCLVKYEGQVWKQVEGVAMGSPLSADISNAFLSIIEEKKLTTNCKPKCYMRYVDDTLAVFEDVKKQENFFQYINTWDNKLEFTKESYGENGLSFLDINLKRVGNILETEVFHKETDTDLVMQFESNIPMKYKKGLVGCLVIRALRVCSNWANVHKEINIIREKLVKNGFPIGMIEHEVKKILDKWNANRIGQKRQEEANMEKEKYIIVKIPYEGRSTVMFSRKTKDILEHAWVGSKIKMVLLPINRLRSLVTNADNVKNGLKSDVIYNYTCQDCQETYIGETVRHADIRFAEHKSIAWKTGKNLKLSIITAIKSHELRTKHTVKLENFDIISRNGTGRWIGRKILESYWIKKKKPVMNNQQCFDLLII